MSELTLFSKGGNNLPAHLRNLELDETTKALMGGSGSTGKRISIRGGVFRMMVNGEEIAKNENRSMNRSVRPSLSVFVICPKFGEDSVVPGSAN